MYVNLFIIKLSIYNSPILDSYLFVHILFHLKVLPSEVNVIQKIAYTEREIIFTISLLTRPNCILKIVKILIKSILNVNNFFEQHYFGL